MVDPGKNGKQNNHWWVEFGSLWPLIPGSVFTLIGVYFLLFDKQLNGVIISYVGLMSLIVGAGKIWMQSIHKQPEPIGEQSNLEAADRRALSETASESAILVICCFVGMVITALAVVCGATVTVYNGGTAIGLFWAFGCMSSGGFIGLLFSIPSEIEPMDSYLHLNTSLNQISDWLTKIIVGISLVNANQAYGHFLQAAAALGRGLASTAEQQPTAKAFAAGLIASFFFLGFIGTYLLARVWISIAIVRADQLALTLAHDENAKRDRTDQLAKTAHDAGVERG
jgi:hypothetical protein